MAEAAHGTCAVGTAELPRLQAARAPRRHAEFYSAETIRIVAERYQHDLALFGSSERPQ